MAFKTVCFTGHRNIPSNDVLVLFDKLKTEINKLYSQGYNHFSAGGAIGFDTLAALYIVELKEKYPDIKLKIIAPFKGQGEGFCKEEREYYNKIIKSADEVEYLFENYNKGCYHVRNKALVDGADACIAYLNEATGGTFYTYNYAKKKGLEVINLGSYKEPQIKLFPEE